MACFRGFGHKILYIPGAPSSTNNLFLRIENAAVSGSHRGHEGVD